MKKILAFALALSMCASLAACGGNSSSAGSNAGSSAGSSAGGSDSQETITFKMSFVDPASSPYAQGGVKVAEEVAAATDGRIQIEVVTDGTLGGERDTVELAMGNNLDIATAANSVMTNFIPEMAILDQAFLWDNADQAHAAVDGPVGDLIEAKAEALGLHVIGYMESGFRNTFSTKPIDSIDDYKGVTIRTMENQYHQAAFESFGAMPVAMSANDVFTALQQGTIDACENATVNCLNSGYYEITKNITNSQHAFVYILLCMSDEAWNKIPEDLREPFLEAVQRGVDYERDLLVSENERAAAELQELGVTFHEIDREALKTAYQAKVAEKGFTFDPEWQAAVDEAIASVAG